MRFNRSYPFFGVALSLLLLGASVNPGWSQSRRQPPQSNEKKNKRPGETTKPGQPDQEPLPKDLEPTKPQDIEKVSYLDADRERRCRCLSQEERTDRDGSEKAKLRSLRRRHPADDHKLLHTGSANHRRDGG